MAVVPNLLIAEDNEADRMLFEECARSSSKEIQLHFCIDGIATLEFLRGSDARSRRVKPDLLLLDLNLPLKDGREVLAELKADPSLRDIPVIVLSTSSAKGDVSRCYALGASDYLVKPADLSKYEALVASIIDQCYALPQFA